MNGTPPGWAAPPPTGAPPSAAPPNAPRPAWAPPPPPVRSAKGLAVALACLVPAAVLINGLQLAFQPTEIRVEGSTVMQNHNGWGVLALPIGLAAIVVGVVWSYRVVANARAVGDPTRPSPGWAVGSWFIPFAHLVLPFFPLREAWGKSRAGSLASLVVWWAVWALYLAVSYVAFSWGFVAGFQEGMDVATGRSQVIETPPALVALQWVGMGLYAAAGAFFLAVVFRFEKAQRRMGAWLQGRRAVPATPGLP